ncbi:MAG: PrgI family protein [Candidatus Vogelbacteria bacterium]|nr:PrgI family protein [Candidatus Vogelbacteria bacterium]
MNFQVPQFIEVEDKIFGPLTFKQFVYLAGGGGAVFMAYALLPIYLSVWLMIPLAVLALALAFYKVNNRPFINVLESAFRYALTHKLYLWKKQPKAVEPTTITLGREKPTAIPKLSQSKLRDLAWSLDVKENIK